MTGAVVTGAGSGLGRALALDLHRRGARVVVADLDDVGAAETVAAIRDAGGEAWAVHVDVSDADAIADLWDTAVGHLGRVDTWVNNAGVAVGGEMGETPLEDWRWIVDINLMGVVHGCHVAAPRLKAQGAGHIVNVASAAGLVSSPMMSAYNATKAAVVAVSETIYQELRPAGVGVTVVCPTFFQTNLLATARTTDDKQRRLTQRLMARSPLDAGDVARRALDDASAGRLYSVAMADGRWLWRLRRAAPQGFYRMFGTLARRL